MFPVAASARAVGRAVGLAQEHVFANCLPEDKLEKVQYLLLNGLSKPIGN